MNITKTHLKKIIKEELLAIVEGKLTKDDKKRKKELEKELDSIQHK